MADHHRIAGIAERPDTNRADAGEKIAQAHVALALAGVVAQSADRIRRRRGIGRTFDHDVTASGILERDRRCIGVRQLRPCAGRNADCGVLCHFKPHSFGGWSREREKAGQSRV